MNIIDNKYKKTISSRNSNFELLRILLMCFVIMHHFVCHGLEGGGLYQSLDSTTKFLLNIFMPLGKISFITFLIMSLWFMVDSRFNSERFFRLMFELFFYSLLFVFLNYVLYKEFDYKQLIACFIPINGNSHGFVQTFLALYLISPFLKKIISIINKKQQLILVIISLSLSIFSNLLFRNLKTQFNLFSNEFVLFIALYLFLSYFKKYLCKYKIFNNSLILTSVLMIFYILGYCCFAFNSFKGFLIFFGYDEFSILAIVPGLSLFLIFKNFKPRYSVLINVLSYPTLGVLILHDHNAFRQHFWNDLINVSVYTQLQYKLFFVIILVSILIYLLLGCIEYIRKFFIENLIFKCSILKLLFSKIDIILNTD